MAKIIGVDIDAVLTDEGRGEDNIWHTNICKYFGLKGRVSNAYEFDKAYNLTLEEIEEFVEARGLDILKNVNKRPYCQNVLRRLKEEGYKIILVTARPENCNKITINWLSKHKIPYDQLIHSEEKADICQQEDIALFIDDNIDNLLPIIKLDIPVLLMNMDHNQDYQGDIIRVNNWLEIEDKINLILED